MRQMTTAGGGDPNRPLFKGNHVVPLKPATPFARVPPAVEIEPPVNTFVPITAMPKVCELTPGGPNWLSQCWSSVTAAKTGWRAQHTIAATAIDTMAFFMGSPWNQSHLEPG